MSCKTSGQQKKGGHREGEKTKKAEEKMEMYNKIKQNKKRDLQEGN